MHELFIQATVTNEAHHGVLAVLQGLCAMTPVLRNEYRRIYGGPQATPLPTFPKDLSTQRPQNHPLWRELGAQLNKQSYYLTTVHDIPLQDLKKDPSSNKASSMLLSNIDENEGSLLFVDFPDPPGTRTYNSRLAFTLNHELQIPTFLASVKYTMTKDYLREVYYAYTDNTTFSLHRDSVHSQTSTEVPDTDAITTNPQNVDFTVFDAESKWVLTVTVEVYDVNKPELVRKATEQLDRARYNLQGIVAFALVARQKMDTRIQLRR